MLRPDCIAAAAVMANSFGGYTNWHGVAKSLEAALATVCRSADEAQALLDQYTGAKAQDHGNTVYRDMPWLGTTVKVQFEVFSTECCAARSFLLNGEWHELDGDMVLQMVRWEHLYLRMLRDENDRAEDEAAACAESAL